MQVVDREGREITSQPERTITIILGLFSALLGVLSALLGILGAIIGILSAILMLCVVLPLSLPVNYALTRSGRRGFWNPMAGEYNVSRQGFHRV